MTYIITISETNAKAKSIVNMFKMLSLNYDFLKITKAPDNLDSMTASQKEEFEKSYKFHIV